MRLHQHGGGQGFNQGLHATWDCPFRYIERCGYCQGFNNDGTKDPAQWMPCGTGHHPYRDPAKDKWLVLIKDFDLALPHDAGAGPRTSGSD